MHFLIVFFLTKNFTFFSKIFSNIFSFFQVGEEGRGANPNPKLVSSLAEGVTTHPNLKLVWGLGREGATTPNIKQVWVLERGLLPPQTQNPSSS